MFDARTYVKFVRPGNEDKQRKLQVRCSTYVSERADTAREHDMCLMRLTDGQIWECYLNGADCTGWENFILRDTAQAFKSYVRGYNAERNIFLVSESIFSAPEFAKRTNMPFIVDVKVRPVSFSGKNVDEEVAEGLSLSGAPMQYKTLISAEELGGQLFKSAVIRNAFVTAPAGFGKSHLIKNVLVPQMKAKYGANKVWVTSSTRVSGDQIGGSTLHSKSGLHRGQGSVEGIIDKMKTAVKKRWATVEGVILDEVSMCSADFIQLFDGVAKAMKGNSRPFGGVQMIFVGDFGQLAPVPQIERVLTVDGDAVFRSKAVAYAFTSAAWAQGNIHLYRLTYSHRYEAGGELGEFLQAIRCGAVVTDEIYEELRSRSLIGNDDESWKDEEAVMLCCRKKDARITNATRLDQLANVSEDGEDKNPELTYAAVDRRGLKRHVCTEADECIDEEEGDEAGAVITEFAHRRSLFASLGANPYLRLRKGAKVLCSHVLDGDVGPGAIGTVLTFRKGSDMHMDAELLKRACGSGAPQFSGPDLTPVELEKDWKAVHRERRWPIVEFVLKDGGRKLMTVPPRVFTVEDSDGVLLVSRVQIPLMLAYCMTVHRAQGLTLEKVVFKMDGIFAYGQLYTALSRVRKMGDMRLVGSIKKGVKLQSRAVMEFEKGNRWTLVDNKPDVM